jgi:uncharacterized SAM-binding protein YcdF (DUF218 family)
MFFGGLRFSIIFWNAIKAFFLTIYDFFAYLVSVPFTRNFLALIIFTCAAWFGGLFWFHSKINESWETIVKTEQNIHDKTEAIVCLTGGSERLAHSMHLLKNNFAPKLFISGVNKDVKIDELFVTLNYSKADAARLKESIYLGFSATSTYENAIEIATWVKKNNIKSIRLVTSNYHMPRAYFEARQLIPNDVVIIKHSVIPLNFRYDKWLSFDGTRNLIIQEYNKYLAARVRSVLD